MAVRTLDPASSAELGTLVPPGTVVLAVTDDGACDRYAPVREAAAAMAGAARGTVVLFHVPPGPVVQGGRPRRFVPPAPDASGAARAHTGSRKTDLLLAEAASIRASGAGVIVWIARTAGPSAIAEAVGATGPALVLVASESIRGCGTARRLDRTLDYYAARIPVPVLSVDRDGRLARVRPLGSGPAGHSPNRVPLLEALRGAGSRLAPTGAAR